jgi:hypothetical protein
MLLIGAAAAAQAPPDAPQPQKEHEWLQQFVGEWESEAECVVAPGVEPIKATSRETCRMLGGFWMKSEGESDMMGTKIQFVLTLGYSVDRKRYIGTWIDSTGDTMWKYEGKVDETGKILTLETEGPSFGDPTKTAKYKEVLEFKSPDHRVFTSSVLGDDGKWHTFITMNTRRVKPLAK